MKRHEKGGPIYITPGTVKVKIYKQQTRGYDRFVVTYSLGGKRVRKTFNEHASARREADDVARKIGAGRGSVTELTAADRDTYNEALRLLRPIGIPLHVAVAEFVEARRLLPDGCTLTAAVRSFAERHRGFSGKRSVADAVTEFLAIKQGKVSERQLNDLRVHLAPLTPGRRARASTKKRMQPFADRFRGSLGAVTAADIDRWLNDVCRGAKRRNNVRASVVALFNWARRQGFLPRDTMTEAEMSERVKYRNKKPEILSPEQLAELLKVENEEARLYVALAAFTGARSAEVLRMRWEAIHYETKTILLREDITKNGTERTVPIQECLAKWLAPYRGRKGAIFSRKKAENVALRFLRKIVRPWPANGLRHSYGSFRLAQLGSKDQVSTELGNSPRVVERHYKAITTSDGRVVTPALAAAWFALSPD